MRDIHSGIIFGVRKVLWQIMRRITDLHAGRAATCDTCFVTFYGLYTYIRVPKVRDIKFRPSIIVFLVVKNRTLGHMCVFRDAGRSVPILSNIIWTHMDTSPESRSLSPYRRRSNAFMYSQGNVASLFSHFFVSQNGLNFINATPKQHQG